MTELGTDPQGAGHDVLPGLADALSDYFELLDRGVSDPTVDAAVSPLTGMSLHSLGGAASVRVHHQTTALRTAIDRSVVEPSPVELQSVRAMSAPGDLGYFPALCGGTDPWAAWLAFDSATGDRLAVQRLAERELPEAARSTPPTGVLVRPTLAGDPQGQHSWVLYAARTAPDAAGWQVRAHALTPAGLGPAQVVSADAPHALNQEAVVDSGGRVHVVHQEQRDGQFQIVYRTRSPGPAESARWSAPTLVSTAQESAWDPCLVLDQHSVTVFWSSYRGGRFRLFWRRLVADQWSEVGEVPTLPTRHAMHPHCIADPSGVVWLTYDSLSIPDEASSGLTRFQRAEAVSSSSAHDPIPGFELSCQIDVVAFRDGEFSSPRSEQPLTERSAACYPKVAVDELGRLWLAYRSMRQLPFGEYVAHAAVRVHQGTDWSAPRLLPASDGTCAEIALVAAPESNGVRLLYHSDNHAARHLAMLRSAEPAAGEETEEQRRREHLRLPSTERVAAGGHVGAGRVTVAALSTTLAAVRPHLVIRNAAESDPWSHQPRRTDARPDTAIAGESNPENPPGHLYWGDLHRHSNISRCGAGLDIGAEDHYRFAEDLLGLDFWALTDHSEHTSDLNWHYLKKLANAFNRPGTHASLIGFEWTSFKHGHLNVIYAGDDGPIMSSVDPDYDDPAKLWSHLAGHQALTIPHHPASWVYPTNWSFHDNEFLRLVEIFQACTGSYESDWCHRQYQDALAPGASVTDALRAGHRLGFVGSTDHGNGVAYVGVYADRLDRAAVLDALADRRCFAATRRGIVPQMRIGPKTMGQEFSLADYREEPVTFGGEGIAELSVVQLVRDGEVVASSPGPVPTRPAHAVLRLDLQVISHAGATRDLTGLVTVGRGAELVATDWYPPEVTSATPTHLTWATSLPEWYGKRQRPPSTVTFGVTLEGDAKADLTIAAGGCQVSGRLADFTTARESIVDGIAVRARPGTGGLTGLGTQSWTGQAPAEVLRPNSWYYVRVIQVDGETAWSSPVWVDD